MAAETPVAPRGRLAALMGGDAFPEKVRGIRVVAEAGLEPATFGL